MAKAIMVQGTTSNAGKSFTAAGLCRIFRQDGYRVAPFKSQNMATNGFVTEDGLEMSCAQAMQAEAAGITPTVCMNPILLKPTGDMGSDVIVNGVSTGHMKARAYFAHRPTLRDTVQAAYDALAAQVDIVVIEGAGSPAEINLKLDDFVNMGMAEMANAPVLLVGDIDPGGVFASIYGTLALLPEHERARVKATVINKFRGDITILEPGLRQLEELTGIPVLGTIPYLSLDLEDEDSLSGRFFRETLPELIDIAVIRLPYMECIADFSPLEGLRDISLRYVDSVRKLGRPDMIILPDVSDTDRAMEWLAAQGFVPRLQAHVAQRLPVLGIGGGFQLLGMHLISGKSGLSLLPMSARACAHVQQRVQATWPCTEGVLGALSGLAYTGYERRDWVAEGQSHKGAVLGIMLHGLFDAPYIVETLIHALCRNKGLEPLAIQPRDTIAHRSLQFDLLAESMREALDMKLLYAILEKGHSA